MEHGKRVWKKQKDKWALLAVSALLALGLMLLRLLAGLSMHLSDLFFTMGVVHLVVGMTRYIRNVGLFKTFSYMAYKRRWRRSAGRNAELHPMTLAEYTQKVIYDEMRQRPVLWPLGFGCGCLVVSALLAAAV